uniref:Integrase catalytic domain-containing protein n=1 Tax=Nicotiana tabacum TaxID=4097 RepID=A0A1S3YSS5_TOBAC|nr:PREDICTED: uncharacterized protein LOC107779160 [Nicotiana tabacum]
MTRGADATIFGKGTRINQIIPIVEIVQIPKEGNAEAGALANLASVAEVTNEENAIVIHLFHSAPDQDKNEWVEAGALKQVREKEFKDFIWRNIICQFGVSKEIVCDNGPQFIGAKITEFFQNWQIKRITSTPYHHVANGQDESTNKVIINNLKKGLEESKGKWHEVLPGVLWAYRTTAKTGMGETPFLLVYGAEALIPVEIGEPSTRYTQAIEESNE